MNKETVSTIEIMLMIIVINVNWGYSVRTAHDVCVRTRCQVLTEHETDHLNERKIIFPVQNCCALRTQSSPSLRHNLIFRLGQFVDARASFAPFELSSVHSGRTIVMRTNSDRRDCDKWQQKCIWGWNRFAVYPILC